MCTYQKDCLMSPVNRCLSLWVSLIMLVTIYQHNKCMVLSHELKRVASLLQKERSREQRLLSSISKWNDYTVTSSFAQSRGFIFLKWNQYCFPKEEE